VVTKERLTGTLTLGQFVKAICSFFGPIITSWATGMAFGWKLVFPIYAATSFIALLWLWLTPIKESKKVATVSFGATLSLFKDRYIVAFFVGILVLVGIDVGMNTTFPKLLMEKCNLQLSEAGLGNSVYFFARTLGALGGGIFLLKYSEVKFFKYSVFFAIAGLVAMLPANNTWILLACVAIFGLGYANLFAIIFSLSLKRIPEKANEVSALLIMGVSGGAVLPPVLGVTSDIFKSQTAALIVITLVWLYMVWLITKVRKI
jgi:fucose permease